MNIVRKICFVTMAWLTVMTISEGLHSQKRKYLPVLEIGKTWIYNGYNVRDETYNDNDLFEFTARMTVEENGHDVYLLFRKGFEDYPVDPEVDHRYIRRVYEEDGVVWLRIRDDDVYDPIIDFNMEVGEKFDDNIEVVCKESVMIEGVERLVMGVRDPYGTHVYYWIEGIGCIDDYYMTPIGVILGDRVRMIECRMGDTCLFDRNRWDAYISGVPSISASNEVAPCYDILGRRIAQPAPGQLYIQGGKKHIAK